MGMAQCPNVSEVNELRCGLGPDHKGNCQFPTLVSPPKEVKALIYVMKTEAELEAEWIKEGSEHSFKTWLIKKINASDIALESCGIQWRNHYNTEHTARETAEKERDELQHVFDLRWKASMRAIKLWQKRTGRKLSWPDHCDMVVWLLEQLDEAKKPKKRK